MSATGEFERYAKAVAAALRDAEGEPWGRLAEEFERNLARHGDDLEARALEVLDGDLLAQSPDEAFPDSARDAIESLFDISHVILGRPRADVS